MTRDNMLWTILLVVSVLTGLAGHFEYIAKAFPSVTVVWQARIELLAFVLGTVAGYLKMSPLSLSNTSTLAGRGADNTMTLNPLKTLTDAVGMTKEQQ